MTDYTKHSWQHAEIIHTDDLNAMEDGIYNAHEEIKTFVDQMEKGNYINRIFTNPDIHLSDFGSADPGPEYTITDLDTSSSSAIGIEVQNAGNSTNLKVSIYGSLGDLPYTTDPIKEVSITASNSSVLFFLTPPQDKIKIILLNMDATASTTVNVVTRVLGNLSFMISENYDSNKDGCVDYADQATLSLNLNDGEGAKSYSEIAQEIDSDIATHAGSATAHHSNANDPTAGQKAALAGTDGTPSSTNKYVTNSDSRMTNARTPTAHTHVVGSITDIASNYEPIISSKGTAFNKNFGSISGTVCAGDDYRLGNFRVPTAHAGTHTSGSSDPLALDTLAAPTDITTLNTSASAHGLCPKLANDTTKYLRSDGTWQVPPGTNNVSVTFGTTTGTCCEGNDVRLTDSRSPVAHASTHFYSGSDAIAIDNLGGASDNTRCNVSSTAHGLCPKLANDTTKFLRSDGSWETPPGGLTLGTTAGTACAGNDSRLSDARAPTYHSASHQANATDPIKIDTLAAPDDNTKLNASSTAHGLCPKLGGSASNFLNGLGNWTNPIVFGYLAGTVCQGNDSRLSDARTPAPHSTSHKSGGSDAIAIDTLAAATDITTLNASTTAHGLCPKLNGTATTFLNGLGNWSTPTNITPAAHATSHKTGGSDVIALDTLGSATDNTNLNVTNAAHGLCPKLVDDTTKFLRSDGTWAAPTNLPTSFIRWEEGTLSTSTTFMPYRITSAKQIKSIKGYIMVLPVGANILIDIRKNNNASTLGSIFSSDAAQSISTSLNVSNGVYQFDFSSSLDAAQTSCVDGDILYIVITQVGSTMAGTGLYLEVGF